MGPSEGIPEKDERSLAVALAYAPGDAAPRLLAKGRGLIADEIILRAKEHGIFVHESPELVTLLMQVDLDEHIPPQLYVAVASFWSGFTGLKTGARSPNRGSSKISTTMAPKQEPSEPDLYSKYMLKSKKEILFVLRGMMDRRSQMTMFFNEGKDMILSALLEVGDDHITLDYGPSEEVNRKAIAARKLFCTATHEKVKIQFLLLRQSSSYLSSRSIICSLRNPTMPSPGFPLRRSVPSSSVSWACSAS